MNEPIKTYQVFSIRDLRRLLKIANDASKKSYGKIEMKQTIILNSELSQGIIAEDGRRQVCSVYTINC